MCCPITLVVCGSTPFTHLNWSSGSSNCRLSCNSCSLAGSQKFLRWWVFSSCEHVTSALISRQLIGKLEGIGKFSPQCLVPPCLPNNCDVFPVYWAKALSSVLFSCLHLLVPLVPSSFLLLPLCSSWRKAIWLLLSPPLLLTFQQAYCDCCYGLNFCLAPAVFGCVCVLLLPDTLFLSGGSSSLVFATFATHGHITWPSY